MWASETSANRRPFSASDSGAVSVEFGLTLTVFMLVLLAAAEFALGYWQWNAASKAVQLGARLAAVTDPVAAELRTLTGLSSGVNPGDPMPFFEIECRGAMQSCTTGAYDAAAMATIVFGRGNDACPEEPRPYPPMCQLFRRVTPENVVISYVHTGLGFAGRPGGPVPTITLRLEDVVYDSVVLRRLLGDAVMMPAFTTTVTGENLSSTAQ